MTVVLIVLGVVAFATWWVAEGLTATYEEEEDE